MALLMAVLSMMLMLAMLLPILSMSATETHIASNLWSSAQSRACAESGLEHVLVELNTPGGAPWAPGSLAIGDATICTFTSTAQFVSSTEINVHSLATGPSTARAGASQRFAYDTVEERWRPVPGTWRRR